MTAIVPLEFSIGAKVRIVGLNLPGTVMSAHIMASYNKYEVRYFWDGTIKEIYFHAWELVPDTRENQCPDMGFIRKQ
jgi:hypothetical protein